MKRVSSAGADSGTRDELFPEIRKSLLAHAQGEEKALFPKANELINGEQADDMLERYEEVEERSKMQL